MSAVNLSAEIWCVVALIAGLAVLCCLSVLAKALARQKAVGKLAEEVRRLREAYSASFRLAEKKPRPPQTPPVESPSDEPARKAA
jgi:hypothetical protein